MGKRDSHINRDTCTYVYDGQTVVYIEQDNEYSSLENTTLGIGCQMNICDYNKNPKWAWPAIKMKRSQWIDNKGNNPVVDSDSDAEEGPEPEKEKEESESEDEDEEELDSGDDDE